MATGHYARIGRDAGSGRWIRSRGVDRDKDQSYFLHGLTQEMLEHVVFPVGGLTKREVRDQARGHGLPNADKAESQDICFIPDGDYRSFVQRLDPRQSTAGEIVDPEGRVIAYEDEEDAVRIANDSDFGLSGSVWSASEERALAVARRIRTGTINVNGGNFYGADAPFGGYKQSGVGREMGVEGFEEYLETKTIAVGL